MDKFLPQENAPPLDFEAEFEEFEPAIPEEDEPYPNSDIDARKVTVTFFPDEYAASANRVELSLIQLAEHIRCQTAASKGALPLLKLAVFGNKRSANNCLRTNENVWQIDGVEVEHNAGTISFHQAVTIMLAARVRCIVYTSPSYVPGAKEKWRALVPLSMKYPPNMRDKLVARINGLFGGELAPESFVLSQSFYYGSVNRNPHHRVEVIDARYLDLCDELYAKSIFKDGSRVGENPASGNLNNATSQRSSASGGTSPSSAPADWDDLVVKILTGALLHASLRDLAAKLVASGMDGGAVTNFLRGLMRKSAAPRDGRWQERYDDIPRLVDSAEQFRDGGRATEIFDHLLRNAGAGAGAGTGGAGASGSTSTGGTSAKPPPLIEARPFVLRDPKMLPRRQWLYGTHLIRKFGSATFAPSGSGKSNLFIVEALALATGRPLLGITPQRRARVWYWNGEDPYDELERRVGAACLHYGIPPEELDGWLFINSGRDEASKIVIATEIHNNATVAVPVVEALIQTIRDKEIDVVMIDPFISSHRVSENNNNAVDTVAKVWTMIADITNTAIDLAHHTRKTNGAEVTVEDGRGAVALLNAVRPARVLNMMTEDEATKAGIGDGRKRYFRVTDGKNNLALPVDKLDWFRSASVYLGNGDPADLLDQGDDMGVVTKWQWPDPLDGMTGADFDKAAAAIRAGQWRKDPQCRDWVGRPIAKALGLGDVSKKGPDKAKVIGLIRIWLASGALVEVERPDVHRMPKIFIEVAD